MKLKFKEAEELIENTSAKEIFSDWKEDRETQAVSENLQIRLRRGLNFGKDVTYWDVVVKLMQLKHYNFAKNYDALLEMLVRARKTLHETNSFDSVMKAIKKKYHIHGTNRQTHMLLVRVFIGKGLHAYKDLLEQHMAVPKQKQIIEATKENVIEQLDLFSGNPSDQNSGLNHWDM